VFVGETREHDVTGFHNWIQFYLQEKAGRLDYRGFFRRGTVIMHRHVVAVAVDSLILNKGILEQVVNTLMPLLPG